MLIPLGFWAASAGGGAGAGSFDLLETQVLASSAASVTFSSLDTLAAGYQHLQIRMMTRTTENRDFAGNLVRFNSDAGSNYATHNLLDTAGLASEGSVSQTSASAGICAGGFWNASNYPATVLDILDPFESTKNITMRAFAGGIENASNFKRYISLQSSLWNNTAAATTINIRPSLGSFTANSRFSLYGIKAGA